MINVDQETTRQWSKSEFYQYIANIFAKSHYDYISSYLHAHRHNETIAVSFYNNEFHLGVKGKDKQKLVSLDNPLYENKNMSDSVNYIVTGYFHYLSLNDIFKYIVPSEEFQSVGIITKIINNFLLLNQLATSDITLLHTDKYELVHKFLAFHIDITVNSLLANYHEVTKLLKLHPNNIIELIKLFDELPISDDSKQTDLIWKIFQTTIFQLLLKYSPNVETVRIYLDIFCKLFFSFHISYWKNATLPDNFKLPAKWLDVLLASNNIPADATFYWLVEFNNKSEVTNLINNLAITSANNDLYTSGTDYLSKLFDNLITNKGEIRFKNADQYNSVVQQWLKCHPEVNLTRPGSRNGRIYQVLHVIFKQLPDK